MVVQIREYTKNKEIKIRQSGKELQNYNIGGYIEEVEKVLPGSLETNFLFRVMH